MFDNFDDLLDLKHENKNKRETPNVIIILE